MTNPRFSSTSKKGRDFELLVERLQRLLRPGEELQHNQFIKDIHTGEPRQVDIAIRSNEPASLTVIECRDYARRQHVDWVESAYGKRISLGATSMILVSKSGFSEPARVKARAFGIVVTTYEETDDADAVSHWMLRSWIRITRMDVEIRETKLHTVPPGQSAPGPLPLGGQYFHLPGHPAPYSIRELLLTVWTPQNDMWNSVPQDGTPVPRTFVLNDRACAGCRFQAGEIDYELSAITVSATVWKVMVEPDAPQLVALFRDQVDNVMLWRTVYRTVVAGETVEFEIVQDGEHLKQLVISNVGPLKIEFQPRVDSIEQTGSESQGASPPSL